MNELLTVASSIARPPARAAARLGLHLIEKVARRYRIARAWHRSVTE